MPTQENHIEERAEFKVQMGPILRTKIEGHEGLRSSLQEIWSGVAHAADKSVAWGVVEYAPEGIVPPIVPQRPRGRNRENR